MATRTITWSAVICAALLWANVPADAQIVESVGERALGMGGAFVAVATDSSAGWWNPAALADGPFFDLSVGHALDQRDQQFPAARDRSSGLSLSTPVVGASLYRFRITDVASPIEGSTGSRQVVEAPRQVRSLAVSALGGTVVQTLVSGTHVGATLKYVRGTLRTDGTDDTSPAGALDRGAGLQGGQTEGHFDLDLGALATAGPVRLGAVVKNLRATEFAKGAFTLPRQARVGVAFAAEQAGGPPLTISFDADVLAYQTGTGERRVVALGAEDWLVGRRIGLRAGIRKNRVGAGERALTAGASIAVRAGTYLEAHVTGSTTSIERGWGAGLRVSF